MEWRAFLGSATHDFALGEDISENSSYVIGSPSDFFAFHPVARLSGDLPDHDGDAQKCEGIKNGLGEGAIHE